MSPVTRGSRTPGKDPASREVCVETALLGGCEGPRGARPSPSCCCNGVPRTRGGLTSRRLLLASRSGQASEEGPPQAPAVFPAWPTAVAQEMFVERKHREQLIFIPCVRNSPPSPGEQSERCGPPGTGHPTAQSSLDMSAPQSCAGGTGWPLWVPISPRGPESPCRLCGTRRLCSILQG